MERMEEHVVGADDQALQYMLTEAQWGSRAVMDQVAQEANQLLGGDESCLLPDESGVEKKASTLWALPGNGMVDGARLITARLAYLLLWDVALGSP